MNIARDKYVRALIDRMEALGIEGIPIEEASPILTQLWEAANKKCYMEQKLFVVKDKTEISE